MEQTKLKNTAVFVYMLLISLVFLAIASRCSPLYPMNPWSDVDCYHTVAKSILNGKILYRDIFDHKGPYLYIFYCIGLLIHRNSFFGIYIVEALCMMANLFVFRKILKLYIKNELIICAMLPFYAFMITTSKAFQYGGSAEEMCLPLVAYLVYYFLKALYRKGRLSAIDSITCGFLAGFLFLVKYTFLGIYIGGCLFIAVYLIAKKNFGNLLKMILHMVVGFIIACVPAIVYFVYNRALHDFVEVYFYDNIFIYGYEMNFAFRIYSTVRAFATMLVCNGAFASVGLVGVVWLYKYRKTELMLLLCLGVFGFTAIYSGGHSYVYYGLILMPLALFGFTAIAQYIEKTVTIKTTKSSIFACIIMFFCITVCSYNFNSNVYFRGYSKDDMPQYKFAKTINAVENSSLLLYDSLDRGFYYAADKVPINKYFYRPNMSLDEVLEEQNDLIENKKVDFVVTVDKELDEKISAQKYICIETDNFMLNNGSKTYYLYRRID